MQNAHIASCRGTEFEYDPNCGTYLEAHIAERPLRFRGYFEVQKSTADLRLARISRPNRELDMAWNDSMPQWMVLVLGI